MAHEQVEFDDVDFEIDDELVIEVENLLSFNDFEDVEVEVPEDLDLEDIDFDDDLILSTLPPLQVQFVDESTVAHVHTTNVKNAKKPLLVCDRCKRFYKKEAFFKRHIV